MASRHAKPDEDEIMLADEEDRDADVDVAAFLDHDEGVPSELNEEAVEEPPLGRSEEAERPEGHTSGKEAKTDAGKKKKEEPLRKPGDLHLPLTRVKRIVKSDPDVKSVSSQAAVLMAKAAELFLETLTVESHKRTQQDKRKIVQYKDVASAVADIDVMEFLTDVIPMNEKKFKASLTGKS